MAKDLAFPPDFSVPPVQVSVPLRADLSTDVVAQRHVLFVTAPFGPFSRRLGRRLRASGARATRVLLNGGDVCDWGLGEATLYRGREADWAAWIDNHIAMQGVTDVAVHGGRDPYALEAIRSARRRGLKVHVFEEGYFRPHWITLERDGVNAASSLPRDPQAYRREAALTRETSHVPVGMITPAAVWWISSYYCVQVLTTPFFPAYRTPFRYTPLLQAWGHILRYLRQGLVKGAVERALKRFLALPHPTFLALMQRPGDTQLTSSSRFGRMADFIDHLSADFAANAPADAHLVFKCHPLDQGLEPHAQVVRAAAQRHGLTGRLHFLDGGRLPAMIRAAKGVVSVNSTGGLSALELGKPTMVLGDAIYNMPGLTHQGGLATFWRAPEAPDMALFADYRAVVIARTQINGAFSTRHGIELAAPEAARRILA
jgi:capsular polysaccharide export protein